MAPTDASVLITGETGTGKEMVARSLHRLSSRSAAPFVAVNCGAVPASLMESELFGHEKGAFTGADRLHRGMFERAHQGTLFLDEITEMAEELEVKLLRVLETGQVLRVGASDLIDVDVRIISATNRQPKQAVADQKLREDLLYRLAVFPIPLPPLRERQGDVRMLAKHFLEQLNRRHDVSKIISETTLEVLETYSWPGNVRELQNTIERAYILAEDELTQSCIRFEGQMGVMGTATDAPRHAPEEAQPGRTVDLVDLSLQEIERRHILRVLQAQDNDKKAAAKVLGISLKTLYNRIRKYRDADTNE